MHRFITRKYIITSLALLLAGMGAGLLVRSGHFYARGWYAQYLLNRAWEQSKKSKTPVNVWGLEELVPVGRLVIRSIGVSAVVLKDADKESLAFGPAHIAPSSRPGLGGNIAIAGHRDSVFRNLGQVKRGEVIELESMSSVQYFIVTDNQVIDPDNTRWIEEQEEDIITLITCYPFDYIGAAPKRYVVRGRLVEDGEKSGKDRNKE